MQDRPTPPCCLDSGTGECPQHEAERRRAERAAKLAQRRPGATWTYPVRG